METEITATPNLDKLLSSLKWEFVFVPWKASRNRNEKYPSLNWIVVLRTDTKSMSVEYMAGSGHCPSYEQRETHESRNGVHHECATGKPYTDGWNNRFKATKKAKENGTLENGNIIPKRKDVIYSLVSDSYSADESFEDWASNFGYDSDSISAKNTYETCVKQTREFTAVLRALGIKFDDLREEFQDY